jgi:hypothetical protein
MLIALTVLAIDHIQRLLHLFDSLGATGMQRVLYHRLLGTTTAPEGSLQGAIGSQARLDLDQSMRSCQHADQGVREFVGRPILDRLRGNLHRLLNRLKQLQFSQLHSKGGQTDTAGKLFRRCDRFVYDDPPLAKFSLYERYGSSLCFWQVPCLWLSATSLGQI